MKYIVYPIISANATSMKVYKMIFKIASFFDMYLFMFSILLSVSFILIDVQTNSKELFNEW